MTVREMVTRMDAPELDRWRQLYVEEKRLVFKKPAPKPDEPDESAGNFNLLLDLWAGQQNQQSPVVTLGQVVDQPDEGKG